MIKCNINIKTSTVIDISIEMVTFQSCESKGLEVELMLGPGC